VHVIRIGITQVPKVIHRVVIGILALFAQGSMTFQNQ
jgi:hypothetical protein